MFGRIWCSLAAFGRVRMREPTRRERVLLNMTRALIAFVSSAALTVTVAAASAQTAPAAPRPATPAPAAPRPATPAAQAPAPAPAPALPTVLPFPADARVAFLDMQAVVSQSKLGKAGLEKMKALTDKKTAELQAKTKQLQTLQQEVQSGGSVLSAAVLTQKNREIERLSSEVQFAQEQAQADVDALQRELLDEFSAKALPIVEEIRKERNLWVVFALGDGSGVAAVNAALDVSAEVVKRLDAATK
jgi:outer membrane protein